MARKNAIGFPSLFGDHKIAIWSHTGPASYTQVSNAVPATGGDIITAGELLGQGGLKTAAILTGLLTSDDGQYEVAAVPITGNAATSAGVSPSSSYTLRWLVSATGAEVSGATNLSGRTIKLLAIGK
jgi:hypothetical protein